MAPWYFKCAIVLLVVAAQANATIYDVTQLTDNDYPDWYPQISGNNVVWEANLLRGIPPYPSVDILLYSGGQVTQLYSEATIEYFFQPRISGSNVAWNPSGEVYLYDGNAVSRISGPVGSHWDVQISGSTVVWRSTTALNDVISCYDGATVTTVTAGPGWLNNSPRVSGTRAVWHAVGPGSQTGVFLYDGTTVSKIPNSENGVWPRISGQNVVWTTWESSEEFIFFYDGETTRMLNDEPYGADPNWGVAALGISGSNVVWSAWDGNDREIYLWNGSEIVQITDNDYDDYSPQIDGGQLVWEGGASESEAEIFLFDGSDIIQLTDNDSWDWGAQISGGNIVWTGYDGHDWEIYMAKPIPEPATLALCVVAGLLLPRRGRDRVGIAF